MKILDFGTRQYQNYMLKLHQIKNQKKKSFEICDMFIIIMTMWLKQLTIALLIAMYLILKSTTFEFFKAKIF